MVPPIREAQIFLAGAPTLATIIVANAPFSTDDLSRLHKATAELGFTELVSPDRDVASPVLRRVLDAGSAHDMAALTQSYHIDLTAPTDDRPFFFNQLVLTDGHRSGRRGMPRTGSSAATSRQRRR